MTRSDESAMRAAPSVAPPRPQRVALVITGLLRWGWVYENNIKLLSEQNPATRFEVYASVSLKRFSQKDWLSRRSACGNDTVTKSMLAEIYGDTLVFGEVVDPEPKLPMPFNLPKEINHRLMRWRYQRAWDRLEAQHVPYDFVMFMRPDVRLVVPSKDGLSLRHIAAEPGATDLHVVTGGASKNPVSPPPPPPPHLPPSHPTSVLLV